MSRENELVRIVEHNGRQLLVEKVVTVSYEIWIHDPDEDDEDCMYGASAGDEEDAMRLVGEVKDFLDRSDAREERREARRSGVYTLGDG